MVESTYVRATADNVGGQADLLVSCINFYCARGFEFPRIKKEWMNVW